MSALPDTISVEAAGVPRQPQGHRRETLRQAADEIFAALPHQILPFDQAAADDDAETAASREGQGPRRSMAGSGRLTRRLASPAAFIRSRSRNGWASVLGMIL